MTTGDPFLPELLYDYAITYLNLCKFEASSDYLDENKVLCL